MTTESVVGVLFEILCAQQLVVGVTNVALSDGQPLLGPQTNKTVELPVSSKNTRVMYDGVERILKATTESVVDVLTDILCAQQLVVGVTKVALTDG